MIGEQQDEKNDSAPETVNETGGPVTTGRSQTRRHLLVLVVAVVGLAIGGGLVISGRSSSNPRSSERSTTNTTVVGDLLPNLGVVPDLAAAKELLYRLDPHSLRPDPNATTKTGSSSISATTTGARGPGATSDPVRPGQEATRAGIRRCQQAIEQQTTDRSLGAQLAAARLQVGVTTYLVVSYALPASGTDPAAVRVVLVGGRSCRVLTAVQH